MADVEQEYPAIAADAVTNPESARLLALLTKAEKALNESLPSHTFNRTTLPID
ncbi:MAG: hypothetical protein ACHP8A_01970 [Terriglobales bacterium]|jgi:hypothetical protein|nr:hypothetical protein [Terriglobales bacterium]